jgi:large subunit ribosomal protein L4
LDKQKINSALFLEGDTPNQNLSLAARNLKDIKYLSVKSVNALDLLRHQKLIISKDALAQLEKNYI